MAAALLCGEDMLDLGAYAAQVALPRWI
jgi:hypothetical protein